MLNICPPKGNGTLDTILVQAEGKTGDQVERAGAMQSDERSTARRWARFPSRTTPRCTTAQAGSRSKPCKNICSDPKPTYSDMALIPAQGRDPQAVDQDVQAARGGPAGGTIRTPPAPVGL